MQLPAPSIVHEVYQEHRRTWTDEEKKMVHDKLNKHGIGDGSSTSDQAISEVMCMIYVDGIRDGRN